MLPFIIDQDWYQRHWLTERKRPKPRPRLRPALQRVAFFLDHLADQAIRWVRIRRQHARDSETLNRFNDRDLRDIGLTRLDIPAILNGTHRRYQDAPRSD
ncbi:hypothetical protein [Rhodopila sp.]|uniref:hypothetical protein n=1 Tax=Rhodopila sp. TaxID=2480087 RepID=UPI003D0BDD3F